MPAFLWMLNLGTALAMTGLVWLIQVVQYPLFREVGTGAFVAYHAGHARLITPVVLPLMGTELLAAAALAWRPPPGLPSLLPWVLLGLVGVTWLSTVFVQIPQHDALSGGFDPEIHRSLVRFNWVRTAAWTARSALLLAFTYPMVASAFELSTDPV